MSNAFMQPEITDKQEWYKIDGPDGITFVPADLIGTEDEEVARFINGEMHGYLPQAFESYVICADNCSVTRIEGFGARMQAPGYLDCTDWSVFDTEEQAEKYLEETYGDNN